MCPQHVHPNVPLLSRVPLRHRHATLQLDLPQPQLTNRLGDDPNPQPQTLQPRWKDTNMRHRQAAPSVHMVDQQVEVE